MSRVTPKSRRSFIERIEALNEKMEQQRVKSHRALEHAQAAVKNSQAARQRRAFISKVQKQNHS